MTFQKGERIRMVMGGCDCPACTALKQDGGTFLREDDASLEVKLDKGDTVSFPISKGYVYESFNMMLENE